MAQTTTVNLLTQTAHPAGQDPISVTGDQQQAASYVLAGRDLQTITWHFSGQFSGDCRIEASLVTSPESGDWFHAYTIDTENEKDGYYNLYGNYVWLRAVVSDWTEGEIQLVTSSY